MTRQDGQQHGTREVFASQASRWDRLGRRAGELITLVDELAQRGAGFRALNTPMDTTTPAGRAFLQIQAAFPEMERSLMR